jgi:pimeloyl-ACP methyl ester carboxylesterase
MIFPKLASSLIIAAALLGAAAYWVNARSLARQAEAEARFPPLGQFVTVSGRQVHAVVKGSGPDLVLIHGAGGNLREFTFQMIDRLSDRYRVIAFDRPGLGYSEALGQHPTDPRAQARHLQAAAAQLGVTDPIVLGHSYGGAVAMGWALTAPTKPHGLVIVSGATMPFPGDVDRWYHLTGGRFGFLINPVLGALAGQKQIDASLVSTFAPNPVPVGYADHIGPGLTLRQKALHDNGQQVLDLKAMLIDMSPSYASLDLPVEILHGTADTTVRLDIHARPLLATLPNAALTVIEGAGHMPHHTHMDRILDAIDRIASR